MISIFKETFHPKVKPAPVREQEGLEHQENTSVGESWHGPAGMPMLSVRIRVHRQQRFFSVSAALILSCIGLSGGNGTFHLWVFLRKYCAAPRDFHWPISKLPVVLPLSPALSSIFQDYRQFVACKSYSSWLFGEQLVSRSLLYINRRYDHISTTIQAFKNKSKEESSSI